jgi:predicted secreted protein
MNWFSGFVVYVILWWILFFMSLPFGVKSPDEAGEAVGPGHATSAPVRPRLWLKAVVVTILAGMLWGVVYWVIESDLVSFRSA